jgi:hypothetical protein
LALAGYSRELVATIRDFLPVIGGAEVKLDPITDQCYDRAVSLYQYCQRICNPANMPYRRGLLSSRQAPGPEESWLNYVKLGNGLDDLCEFYGWQGVADNSRRPMSRCRRGGTIAPVPRGLIDAIERPALRLYELNKGLESPAPARQKGQPGRRGYPIKVLNYAWKLRKKHPDWKLARIRTACMNHFSPDDVPINNHAFRTWMKRKRTKSTK